MKLTITSEKDNIVRAVMHGRITQKEVSTVAELFPDTLGQDAWSKNVLLNMESSEFIDSSGISWLLSTHRRFREKGGRLVLHTLTPSVMNVLRVLRMQLVLDVAESEALAEQKLSEN
ncbi:STAS domain-containing protein [Lignipirellula cremea]|uniref:STAS domain protein n=1 Tax=Lignipirellula cremea TaxID=2528010 RepID=A0A518DU58_9BACT|nr:STAS domain-containing protein [Lignipirellula cremea]QDU95366.1 STAS domain protein [Lignipirellula cremea]